MFKRIGYLTYSIWLLIALLFPKNVTAQLREYNKSALLMGCAFEFTIVDTINSSRAYMLLNACVKEVTRIENLISSWDKKSQTYVLNKNAGTRPVKLDSELYALIKRSMHISKLTQGAFDIAFDGNQALDASKFDGRTLPYSFLSDLKKETKTFSYQDILILSDNKVMLQNPKMKISFGAVGKGYAADKVKNLLENKGIKSGVINASGDLTAWGLNARGTKWNVGISDPSKKDEILLWVPLQSSAVATSGDYEKYFMVGDKRYAHIIDPKTGIPTSGIKSTTVISKSAELSDALATSLFVMGPAVGIDFINQLPGIDCIIVDDQNKIYFSTGFKDKIKDR